MHAHEARKTLEICAGKEANTRFYGFTDFGCPGAIGREGEYVGLAFGAFGPLPLVFGAFGGDFYGSLGIHRRVRSIAQAASGSHPSPLVCGVRECAGSSLGLQ